MKRRTFTASFLSLVLPAGCSRPAQPTAQKHATVTATTDPESRRKRTQEILTREGVPFTDNLPVLATTKNAKLRSAEEIAFRAVALSVVCVKGFGNPPDHYEDLIEDYGLGSVFSPKEKQFVADPAPAEFEKTQFAWRCEAYKVLLWSIGQIDDLGLPGTLCNVDSLIAVLDDGREGFFARSRLRPANEIFDAHDLIYNYHWATTEQRLGRASIDESIAHPGIVMEWHYALNWLISYLDQDWDNVTTDT